MQEAPRVEVVDWPTLCREGLTNLLAEAGFKIVASTCNPEEATEAARATRPDLAMVKVRMGPDGGFSLASRIIDVSPNTKVILLSHEEHRSDVLNTISCGASAYILESSPFASLRKAMELVLEGEAVMGFNAAAAELRTLASRTDIGANRALPHQREMEVLRQVAQGKSNKEVAIHLGISERTVQAHLAGLFRRWNVNSRTAAVLHAVRVELISIDELP
ncbi:MAG: response regulator transcription factor [Dehalococcoidia bacterium]|nr:response regulator transcription factor [Dehalococcoidia bacterium]